MRILNVFPDPAGDGGSERSMHLGAAGLRAAGHQVYLLHGSPAPNRWPAAYDGDLRSEPIFDRRSILSPAGLAMAERAVAAYVDEQGIDLLHVQGWPRTEVLRRWADERVVVSTTHVALCPNNARYQWSDRQKCDRDIGFGCLTTGYRTKGCGHLGNGVPIGLPGFVRGMVDDRTLRGAIARSSLIISPSAWLKNRLVRDGMPPERLRVLPPPMEQLNVRPSTAEDEDCPVLIFVGRLVDFKGPDLLLRASARINIAHRVWILGDGPMRDELVALASELGVSGHTEFLGRLSPDQVQSRRLASRVAIVPSLCPENFAMVGAEAMRAGLPLVAFNVGGNSEWLRDGVTGRLVPAGNVEQLAAAIGSMLADPASARSMGATGEAFARQWSVENHASALAGLYREAVDLWNAGSIR